MARKKRARRKSSFPALAAGRKHHHHRRHRRLSAKPSLFKMLSNPVVGTLVGGAAGIVIQNLLANKMKMNAMVAAGVPVALGFLLRKKVPFAAGGMVAVPLLRATGKKIAFLSDEMTSFVSDDLLSQPLLLAGDGSPLLLTDDSPLLMNDQGYMLNEMEEDD